MNPSLEKSELILFRKTVIIPVVFFVGNCVEKMNREFRVAGRHHDASHSISIRTPSRGSF